MRLLVCLLVSCISTVGRSDVAQITNARHQGNLATLVEMSQQNLTDPFETAYLNYSLATLYLSRREKKLATPAIEDSLDALGKTVDAKNDADSLALWSATLGLKISVRPMSGIRLGRQNKRLIQQAIALEPENPTVWLVRGIGLSNTPKMFGGGEDKALEALNMSLSLFNENKPTERQWGHADAYVWRSRVYQKKRQTEKAMADLNSALMIAPDYQWARKLLGEVKKSRP